MAQLGEQRVIETQDGVWTFTANPIGNVQVQGAPPQMAPNPGPPILRSAEGGARSRSKEVSDVPVLDQEASSISTVLLENHEWQVCRDEMGEFYFHIPTSRTYTQVPRELQIQLQNRRLHQPPPPGSYEADVPSFAAQLRQAQLPSKFGYSIHDTVIWKKEDDEIPKGTTGNVVGFTDEHVRVQWPRDVWDMNPQDLTKVRSAVDTPSASSSSAAPGQVQLGLARRGQPLQQAAMPGAYAAAGYAAGGGSFQPPINLGDQSIMSPLGVPRTLSPTLGYQQFQPVQGAPSPPAPIGPGRVGQLRSVATPGMPAPNATGGVIQGAGPARAAQSGPGTPMMGAQGWPVATGPGRSMPGGQRQLAPPTGTVTGAGRPGLMPTQLGMVRPQMPPPMLGRAM